MEIKILALLLTEPRLGSLMNVCGQWADLNLIGLLTHLGRGLRTSDGSEQRESVFPIGRWILKQEENEMLSHTCISQSSEALLCLGRSELGERGRLFFPNWSPSA